MFFLLLRSVTKEKHGEDHYQYCGRYGTADAARAAIRSEFKAFGYTHRDFVIAQAA